jgi:hypothetical protein
MRLTMYKIRYQNQNNKANLLHGIYILTKDDIELHMHTIVVIKLMLLWDYTVCLELTVYRFKHQCTLACFTLVCQVDGAADQNGSCICHTTWQTCNICTMAKTVLL